MIDGAVPWRWPLAEWTALSFRTYACRREGGRELRMSSEPTRPGSAPGSGPVRINSLPSSGDIAAHPLLATVSVHDSRSASPHSKRHDSLAPPPNSEGSAYRVYKPRQRPLSIASTDSMSHHERNPSTNSVHSNWSTSVPRSESPTSTASSMPITSSLPASAPITSLSKPTVAGAAPGSSSARSSTLTTGAAESLQFQNLRGDAQSLGLDGSSFGWAILQALGSQGPEWAALRNVLDAGHTTLLLPRTPLESDDSVTPSVVLDHTLLGSAVAEAGLERGAVLPGGWRGLLGGDRLVIASVGRKVDITSKEPHDLASIVPPGSPLVSLSAELTTSAALRFPMFTLTPSPTSLTIPLFRPSAPPVHPSRLHSRPALGGSSTTARLASLFAASRPPSDPVPSYDISAAAGHIAQEPAVPLVIPAAVIDHPLRPSALTDGVRLALQNRVREGLRPLCDDRITEKVVEFVDRFAPAPSSSAAQSVPSISPTIPAVPLPGRPSAPTPTERPTETGPLHLASADELADALQALFEHLESILAESTQDTEHGRTRPDREQALETVEDLLCGELLYDHFFGPLESDDAVEDEKIAARIAGLNLADLSLDHLGLDLDRRESDEPEEVAAVKAGLEELVEMISAELLKLQEPEYRSPREKLGVFVGIHKLIVEGLTALPPIPMRDENSDGGGKAHRIVHGEVEMTDTGAKGSRPPSILDGKGASGSGKSATSSADVILPLLIYSIVRSNPPRLLSHVFFAQRFRTQSLVRGEAAYCLVNVDAVCEFVRNIDTSTFTGPDRVPFSDTAFATHLRTNQKTVTGRDRLASEVENAVGAATRVVTNVFGNYQRMLSEALDQPAKLIGGNSPGPSGKPRTLEDVKNVLSGQAKDASASFTKARAGLLRRATAVNGPLGSRERTRREDGRELIDVTSGRDALTPSPFKEGKDTGDSDTRSTRSFTLFGGREEGSGSGGDRPSIANRLSSFPGLARLNSNSNLEKAARPPGEAAKQPGPFLTAIAGTRGRRATLGDVEQAESAPLQTPERRPESIGAPIERFMTCEAEDLTLGEILELLADYRRLATAVTEAGLATAR